MVITNQQTSLEAGGVPPWHPDRWPSPLQSAHARAPLPRRRRRSPYAGRREAAQSPQGQDQQVINKRRFPEVWVPQSHKFQYIVLIIAKMIYIYIT